MRACRQCGAKLEEAFRFCPWCSASQRSKLVEFFRPHPEIESDAGRALRVSRYIGPAWRERHVRFSVWNEPGVAQAAVSLDDKEAERLGHFLLDTGSGGTAGGTVGRSLSGSSRAATLRRRQRLRARSDWLPLLHRDPLRTICS
jgi:hypothetical protein